MKKEQREKMLLVLVVVFGVIYLYVNYLFLPEWSNIQHQSKVLNERRNYYTDLTKYQAQVTELQQEIHNLESEIEKLKAQIPGSLDKPQLMVYLYETAKAFKVTPQNLSFEQIQNKGSYQALGMSFNCTGSPADVLGMIQKLQSTITPRLTIQGVNLSVQQGVMRAELKLTAYAGLNSAIPALKPPFMNANLGVDSAARMFTP